MTITKLAAKKIRELLDKEESKGFTGVRIKVVGGGCSGLSNKLVFENIVTEDDSVETFEYGVNLYIDLKSMLYLTQASLDFDDGLMGKGLFIHNPIATNQCGCGESYAV